MHIGVPLKSVRNGPESQCVLMPLYAARYITRTNSMHFGEQMQNIAR